MTSRNFLSPPGHEKTLHPGNLIIASGNAQLLMYKVHFTVNFETSSLNEIILQNFTHDIFSKALWLDLPHKSLISLLINPFTSLLSCLKFNN